MLMAVRESETVTGKPPNRPDANLPRQIRSARRRGRPRTYRARQNCAPRQCRSRSCEPHRRRVERDLRKGQISHLGHAQRGQGVRQAADHRDAPLLEAELRGGYDRKDDDRDGSGTGERSAAIIWSRANAASPTTTNRGKSTRLSGRAPRQALQGLRIRSAGRSDARSVRPGWKSRPR